jgi:hypothetical protein
MSSWAVNATRLYQATSMGALNVDPERYLMAAIGCTSTEIDPNDCLEDASVSLKNVSSAEMIHRANGYMDSVGF